MGHDRKASRTFREALADLGNGDVTAPILLDGAVYVLRRSGERKDGLVDITQARVWLARAILPISAQASEAERLKPRRSSPVTRRISTAAMR